MLAAEPDIADTVILAFILRRAGFISHEQAAVTILSPPRDPIALRIQQFLSRNGYPFRSLATDGWYWKAPGGQAGTSSRIENYLGFPIGISGQSLAGRAQVQAQKFGARIVVPRRVERLITEGEPYGLAA